MQSTFFLIFFIYLLENVRCYKGEHVFPNGTISLTLLRGYYSKKNAICFFFNFFIIYLWENVRCYKGEHVFPNGTISLTLVSIFILKKKKKKI